MRIAVLAIGFVFALSVGATLAEPRILLVQDATPAVPPLPAPPAPPAVEGEPPPVQAQTPAPAPAQAQAPAQAPLPPARFTFERSKDGFLRLDAQTGQVAYCESRSAGWTCEAVPEERTALEKEIGRLQDEVASLKRELAALREPPPRPPADLAPRPPGKEGEPVIKLPTQEDVDRATAALQRAWDRLVDMIGNLRKDLSRKSQPDRTTL
jgi:hypothetical protein